MMVIPGHKHTLTSVAAQLLGYARPQSQTRKQGAKINIFEFWCLVYPLPVYPCGRGNSAISDA
jgi:hypothetical protein